MFWLRTETIYYFISTHNYSLDACHCDLKGSSVRVIIVRDGGLISSVDMVDVVDDIDTRARTFGS